MRNLLKNLGFLAMLVILSVLDMSLLPAIGGFAASLNATLLTGLFLVVIVDEKIALLVYLLASLISILTASVESFVPIILGSAVIVLVNWLFESFFTNRSYYTLIALGLFGWFSYYILYGVLDLLGGVLHTNSLRTDLNYDWITGIIAASVVAVIFWSLGYAITKYMSVRFKSYFIVTHK